MAFLKRSLFVYIVIATSTRFVTSAFVPSYYGHSRIALFSGAPSAELHGNPRRATLLAAASSSSPDDETRRQVLIKNVVASTLFLGSWISGPLMGSADAFTRETKDFSYEFVPPAGFEATNKPLKTHLDEINFVSEDLKGYQIGITVDPVRIKSLKEFGTPEEVAARVVTAEVNRDGVFDVTLVKDPIENSDTGGYEMNYLSSGKRGNKHFVANILIENGKLYVVTGQVKEENYKEKESELTNSVRSFRVKAA